MKALTMRWIPAFIVAMLIVLAGCSSGGGSTSTNSAPSAQPSATPAPAGSSSPAKSEPASSPYPEKDITLVVPHDAGGGVDTYARAIVPYVIKHLPKQVNIIVENRVGASGVTGANQIYKAKPDGYTLGFVEPGGLYVQQSLLKVDYDVSKFNWLAQLRHEPGVIFTTENSKVKSFDDLLKNKLVVSVPQKRTAAGIGAILTFDNLGIEYGLLAGTGTSEAVTATIRGDADIHYNNTGGVMTNVEDGDLIPLAISSDKRYEPWPDVPTIAELGYPELANVGVFMAALTAPPGVPDDVLQILQEATKKAINDPDFLKWSKDANRPVVIADSAETTENVKKIAESYDKYLDTIKEIFAN